MKHIILSRCRFTDKDLMMKYLDIAKYTFVPSIKSQTTKNFTLGILLNPKFEEDLYNFIQIPFVPFYNIQEFNTYVKSNNVQIQTRHDIDDWMSPNYVAKIQEIVNENKNNVDSLIIHAQPKKLLYYQNQERNLSEYTDTRISMFLTLYQKEVVHTCHSRIHRQMYQISQNIIKLPVGYTKWVIHENNQTVRRKK